MRLNDRPLSFVVNFLLGVAWAAALLGAITSFMTFYNDSFIYAFISAFIGALPGMVAILLIEHFITSKEKHLELQKQTKILQQLLTNKEHHTPS
jgi:zinc transporter ZupT